MNLSQKTRAALDLSQAFEGTIPYANITGNFDEMGLTCGALGKTFENGEMQKLVSRFLKKYGESTLNHLMPSKGKEYASLCAMPPAQGMKGIIRWSVKPTSSAVKQPHKQELEQFWTSPGMVSIQIEDAENREGKRAETAVNEWNGEDSLHEFCFFFDIMTQHGSLKNLARADVKDFVSQQGSLDKAGQAIVNECLGVISTVNHYQDTRKNGKLWNSLFPQASKNSRELFILGYLRAKKSNSKWIYVALNRRGTFGLGEGVVNGTQHNLREAMGITTTAPAVLTLADLPATIEPPQGHGTFRVTAASLNFRSSPEVSNLNRLGVLHHGQLVTKISETDGKWWKISAEISSQTLEGFVSSAYLEPQSANPPLEVGAVTAVHLRTSSSSVTRKRGGGRVFHLNENDIPYRTGTSDKTKLSDIEQILAYLDVGNKSKHKRYRAGGGNTYCNIYAYDYCCLTQAFLPRNWWTGASIAKLTQGVSVEPKYDKTVKELRANDLHDWFQDWGAQFGWKPAQSPNELQNAANQGKVCIIVAKRTNTGSPGHITAVVPETATVKATRHGGIVFIPVQSQAGSNNFTRETPGRRFWTGSQFQSHGFWIHD